MWGNLQGSRNQRRYKQYPHAPSSSTRQWKLYFCSPVQHTNSSKCCSANYCLTSHVMMFTCLSNDPSHWRIQQHFPRPTVFHSGDHCIVWAQNVLCCGHNASAAQFMQPQTQDSFTSSHILSESFLWLHPETGRENNELLSEQNHKQLDVRDIKCKHGETEFLDLRRNSKTKPRKRLLKPRQMLENHWK